MDELTYDYAYIRKSKNKKVSFYSVLLTIVVLLNIVSVAMLASSIIFSKSEISFKKEKVFATYYAVFIDCEDKAEAKTVAASVQIKGAAGYIYDEKSVILGIYLAQKDAKSVKNNIINEYKNANFQEIFIKNPVSEHKKYFTTLSEIYKSLYDLTISLDKDILSTADIQNQLTTQKNIISTLKDEIKIYETGTNKLSFLALLENTDNLLTSLFKVSANVNVTASTARYVLTSCVFDFANLSVIL